MQQTSSSSWWKCFIIKELIKVAACSGLLTLPVVVINKGSCKTLGRQRTERRAPCFACLLDNGDGGIYFPPMLLLLGFPQKRVDFEMNC